MNQMIRNGAASVGISATGALKRKSTTTITQTAGQKRNGDMPSSVTMPLIRGYPPQDPSESLFEHVSWLYIFCRETLFAMTPIGLSQHFGQTVIQSRATK